MRAFCEKCGNQCGVYNDMNTRTGEMTLRYRLHRNKQRKNCSKSNRYVTTAKKANQ